MPWVVSLNVGLKIEMGRMVCLPLGKKKAVTNLDSILKSRDITLLTKVHVVRAVVFLVVMYG